MRDNMAIFDGDLYGVNNVPSATHCQFECQKSEPCLFFSYNSDSQACSLKNANASTGSIMLVTTGPKFCITKESKKINFEYLCVGVRGTGKYRTPLRQISKNLLIKMQYNPKYGDTPGNFY
jgi:hypothetical protein